VKEMIKMAYNFNTHMTFENGLTISFAIGEGNYCSNRSTETNPYETYIKERESNDCEVLVFNSITNEDLKIKQFLPEGITGDGNTYAGWIKADDLADIIQNVKNWKA
jgi:hypothetical protein